MASRVFTLRILTAAAIAGMGIVGKHAYLQRAAFRPLHAHRKRHSDD